MNEVEIKYKNKEYLLKVEHSKENIKSQIYKRFTIYDCNLERYVKLCTWKPLTLSFGKYKGLIVDIILEEDRDYVLWFLNNVQGRDFNTLIIKDYLHFKCNKRDYYINDIKETARQVLQELYHDEDLDKNLSKFMEYYIYETDGYNSSEFNYVYNDNQDDYLDVVSDCIPNIY